MNKKQVGTAIVILMTAIWFAISWFTGNERLVPFYVGAIVGQISICAVLAAAQFEERKKNSNAPPRTRRYWWDWILLFSIPSIAKAIIAIAIGIGFAVGLIGLVGIKIWSMALSVKMNELRKPINLAEASVSQPILIAAAAPEPAPEFALAADGSPDSNSQTARVLSIIVPANTGLEFSTNMINWTELHWSGHQDEMTFWEPQGPSGFFRLKSYEPPAATDPSF